MSVHLCLEWIPSLKKCRYVKLVIIRQWTLIETFFFGGGGVDPVLNTDENYFLTKMLGDHICFFIALAYIDRAMIGNLSVECYSSALVEGTRRWIQRIVFFDEEVLFFGNHWLTFLPEVNVLYLVRQFGEQITMWTTSSSATLWGNFF